MRIGVLALQGAFREHLDTLGAIGVEGVRVREPADLDGLSGLILPGGESTTMRRLIERWGLRGPIMDFADSGAPVFGTCAGMIVLSREIAGGEEPILPLLDVTVERNAFGRQLESFEADLDVDVLGGTPVHAVFIRAPIIERTGPGVDVLGAPRRRADRGGPRAEHRGHLVPPGARRGDALPPAGRDDGGRARRSRRGLRTATAPDPPVAGSMTTTRSVA